VDPHHSEKLKRMINLCGVYRMLSYGKILTAVAAFSTTLSLLTASSLAFTEADEVNPAEARRAWLFGADRDELTPPGAAGLSAPYVLTAAERTKFGMGTFGINFSHYDFDLNSDDAACQTQAGYDKPNCSCQISWEKIKGSGITFTYAKASDGDNIDLSFRRYWSDLKKLHDANLLYRGAYHFLRATPSAEEQAATFLSAIGVVGGKKPPDQLPPVLDLEWMNRRVTEGTAEFNKCPAARRTRTSTGYICDMWHTKSATEIVALAEKWIDIVQKATGRPVIIYTNATAWWDPVLGATGNTLASRQAFWPSRYTLNGPTYNAKWTSIGGSPKWGMPMLPGKVKYDESAYKPGHFWQFTEDGRAENKVYTCRGKLLSKPMELNYIPVKDEEFRRLMLNK
jgi:GH25 family lysozyme M1 (1,4-beta-N-acetylmuramidase)